MDSKSSSDLPGQLHEPKTVRPGRVNMSDAEMQSIAKKDYCSEHGKRQAATPGASGVAFGRQNGG